MKQKSRLSLLLNCIGILIFVAMGLNLIPGNSNLMIFLGVACFIISSFVSKFYSQNNNEDNNHS